GRSAGSGVQRLAELMGAIVAEALVAVGNVSQPVTVVEVRRDQLDVEAAVHAAGAVEPGLSDRSVVRSLRVDVFERCVAVPVAGLVDGVERLSVAGAEEFLVSALVAGEDVVVAEVDDVFAGAEGVGVGAKVGGLDKSAGSIAATGLVV